MIYRNKYFLSIMVATMLAISGCATTNKPMQVERKGKVYDVAVWSCYDAYDYYKRDRSLLAWYTPNDAEYGVIELSTNDRFKAEHSRSGVQHQWNWGMHRITIGADGSGYYYDFTGVSIGESVKPSEIYNCVRS